MPVGRTTGALSTPVVLASDIPITLTENIPTDANILVGRLSLAVTTAATTLITIPAGRTWSGQITASVSCTVASASGIAGQATAEISTAGTGVVPAAGIFFGVHARVGTGSVTSVMGASNANFGSLNVIVKAPAGNSATIQLTTTQSGSTSTVDATAYGQLI